VIEFLSASIKEWLETNWSAKYGRHQVVDFAHIWVIHRTVIVWLEPIIDE